MNKSTVSIEFPDEGFTISISVGFEKPGCYRLYEHPTLCESVHYGDLIRATEQDDGTLKFQEVVERGVLQMADYVMS